MSCCQFQLRDSQYNKVLGSIQSPKSRFGLKDMSSSVWFFLSFLVKTRRGVPKADGHYTGQVDIRPNEISTHADGGTLQ